MFLVILTVVFCEINIDPLLSMLNLIVRCNLTFKNYKIPLMNRISLIISDNETYSDSVELVSTIGCCLDYQATKFEFI